MSRIGRICFVAYSLVSFGGSAVMLRGCTGGGEIPAFAQTQPEWERDQQAKDSAREMAAMKEKQVAIEKHVDANDTRIDVLSDKLSFIEGGGTICLAVLGVLNTLGLLSFKKAGKESS